MKIAAFPCEKQRYSACIARKRT